MIAPPRPDMPCIILMFWSDEGEFEGHIDIYDVDYHLRSARVGVGAQGPPSAGRTKQAIKLFDLVFRRFQLQRLQAEIRESNEPAQRIAQKLGFVQEGRLRKAAGDEDVMVYGLLVEEFRRKWIGGHNIWLRQYRGS